ncbi:MAG: B12-binding domain-containing radical SAM protein [Bacteriovoracaceae bacterium]|nr:B12-binding domain-containing radical SAM protein [Bacteriovoracaceae bacterium]
MDVLFVNPGNSSEVYQDLAKDYSAIEPPTWALLLAESCRSSGFKVGLVDANAEKLTSLETFNRVNLLNPRLVCFVVYGQNVNAGTVGMANATHLSSFFKKNSLKSPIAFIGSYVQALPKKALLDEPSIDMVFTNEGVYALKNLLSLSKIDINSLDSIKGIGWRKDGVPHLNPPEQVVPSERMDIDLPGYAWDLLPKKIKPLDLYRAPMWHAEYDQNKRSPYAAIQTSIGCMFSCSFCMINIINRNDNEEIGVAGNYSKMRFWSPEFIIKEFDKLVSLGVETIKITDEMFLLNKKFYVPLCEMLKERGYGKKLRMWAYSRVDTISNPELLKLVREAGIKWLCLGIESSNRKIRLEIAKGKFQDVDIKKVVEYVHSSGINVLANYIFGLPGETMESMQQTLDLSLELCTAGWNAYAAMPLPGSLLYKNALNKGLNLPINYIEFSFHSYETAPLATEFLTSAQILKFRDDAYTTYHSDPKFLKKIGDLLGPEAVDNIQTMAKVKLKRKILGD